MPVQIKVSRLKVLMRIAELGQRDEDDDDGVMLTVMKV